MDTVIKLCGIAVIGSVLALSIRKYQPEISLLLSLCAAIFIIGLGTNALSTLFGFLTNIANKIGVELAVLEPLGKVLSVGFITKFSSDVCKDAGNSGLAGSVELIGNTIAVVSALPLFQRLLQFLSSI